MTNEIVTALEDGAEKVGKAAGEDFAKAYQTMLHQTGENLEQSAKTQLHNDANAAEKLRGLLQRGEQEAREPGSGAESSKIGAALDPKTKPAAATFGSSASSDYKGTFFKANPTAKGNVVVHHAVEQQTLRRYPGVVTSSEMHSLENLRGIPKGDVNNRVHLSAIRKEWNRFYKANPNPTKQQLLDHATTIDNKYGHLFNPPVR